MTDLKQQIASLAPGQWVQVANGDWFEVCMGTWCQEGLEMAAPYIGNIGGQMWIPEIKFLITAVSATEPEPDAGEAWLTEEVFWGCLAMVSRSAEDPNTEIDAEESVKNLNSALGPRNLWMLRSEHEPIKAQQAPPDTNHNP